MYLGTIVILVGLLTSVFTTQFLRLLKGNRWRHELHGLNLRFRCETLHVDLHCRFVLLFLLLREFGSNITMPYTGGTGTTSK
jgi:hypothetical protein